MELDHGNILKAKRAKHRAKGDMVEEGRMWKVGDGSARARAWLECMTQEETVSHGMNIAIQVTSIMTGSRHNFSMRS